MAAPARAPKSADARIACPLCGGLIHPIAGRCKHCKADLSALRATRPAAAASLPALLANGNHQVHVHPPAPVPPPDAPYVAPPQPAYAPPPPQPHAPIAPNGNGHSAYAPVPNGAPPNGAYVPMPAGAPLPLPISDGSQPILPPRPTGRMYAAQTAAGASWWKSWPLIVIVLAALAIVTAVVLMVWPPGGKNDPGQAKGTLPPPPAPERMDTNPLPPNTPTPTPRTGDPWNSQGSTAPDIDVPDDPDPPVDPGTGTYGGNLSGQGAIMMSMMRHACDRAAACGPLDSTLKDYCDMTKALPKTPPPASCPAAKRCLDTIDAMSCSAGFDDVTALSSVMYKFQDCVEAISC